MPVRPDRTPLRLALILAALVLLALAAALFVNQRSAERQLAARAAAMTGGDVARGRSLFQLRGCVACHALEGVPQARGRVGPPLDGFSSRAVIAGKLANNPANLRRWIVDPQAVTPGSAMPRLGITPREARDLSAFLYSRS
jgi:cytochrome c2